MDRVAFNLFGIDVMWYGVIITLGVILGAIVAIKNARRENLDDDLVIDLLIFAIPVAIVSARAYYVIFSWDNYGGNILDMINFRQGGLAIHGGLIGAVLTAYVYCKIKKIEFWRLADIMAPGIILGQAIGRWGNYINQEAYGGPTDLPWAIVVDGVSVHPTFLYESIWNILIFVFLMVFIRNYRKFNGEIFLLYAGLYSVGRFFIEGLRTDSLMVGDIRVAQLISVLIAITSAIIIYIKRKNIE